MSEPVEWEASNCLLCGSADRVPSDSVVWREETFAYVLCNRCGLKYMHPRPSQRWYHVLYEQEFWQEKIEYRGYTRGGAERHAQVPDGLAKRLTKQQWRAERIIGRIAQHVPLTAASTVVDVGAAFGVTLRAIRDRFGSRVAAVEPSTTARDYGRDELGVEYVGRYMEDLFAPTPLDGNVTLLILSHVLENIVDPRAALQAARRLLSADGFLYVDTSNFFYYNAINPYHPYIFNPATLEDLLAQCGFVVIAREHEPHPRDAVDPSDQYLMFLAQPGASTFTRSAVSVADLVADQELGMRKLSDANTRRKLARKAIR